MKNRCPQAQSIVRQVCVCRYSSWIKCDKSALEGVHGKNHLRATNKRPRQDQVYSTDVQNRLYYGNKSVKTLYKTITTHCVTPGRGYLKSQALVNI